MSSPVRALLCALQKQIHVFFLFIYLFFSAQEDHFTHTVTEKNIAASFAPMQFLWQRTEGLDGALFCL